MYSKSKNRFIILCLKNKNIGIKNFLVNNLYLNIYSKMYNRFFFFKKKKLYIFKYIYFYISLFFNNISYSKFYDYSLFSLNFLVLEVFVKKEVNDIYIYNIKKYLKRFFKKKNVIFFFREREDILGGFIIKNKCINIDLSLKLKLIKVVKMFVLSYKLL